MNKPTTKRITRLDVLLATFDERTKNVGGADRALFLLLDKYKDKLPQPDGYFHKAFRQIEVTDSWFTDMLIWHLLQSSELFWKCFKWANARGAIKRFKEENS